MLFYIASNFIRLSYPNLKTLKNVPNLQYLYQHNRLA